MKRDNLIIESGTNYAFSIRHLKDYSFKSLRSISKDFLDRLPTELTDELYVELERGTCILDNEPALNMYIYSFGLMHEAKLRYAFDHLDPSITTSDQINIIDYGCGQGIAAVCYADYLKDKRLSQSIKKVILIEPSQRALQRAALHVSKFFPDADIETVNKDFDRLKADDLSFDKGIPSLHLFSNIIDLADQYYDLSNFTTLISSKLGSDDHVICVGPYFEYEDVDSKYVQFFKGINLAPYFQECFPKGKFIEGKNWSCQLLLGSVNYSSSKLDELVENGIQIIERGIKYQYLEAVRIFDNAAAFKHPKAMNYLALCYENGYGVPQSFDKAFKWHLQGAENEDVKSMRLLGEMYLKGQGVEKSDEMAFKWRLKAVEKMNSTNKHKNG